MVMVRVRVDDHNSVFLLSRHQLRASSASRAALHGRGKRQQRRIPARVDVVTKSPDLDPRSICDTL